jgi:site-specific DNA-methyltransferase (adenine-specific)
MKFDVIIGNPPYQLSNEGGRYNKSATPLYNKFVQQAKKLNPRYLVMIIPSRWFASVNILSNFRAEMLNDDRIRKIVDFEKASEVFPSVDIAGGVCYFLWERDTHGLCEVTNVRNGNMVTSVRRLDEFPTFIRHIQAVPIVKKVLAKKEKSMREQVSTSEPFGIPTFARPQEKGDILLRCRSGEGFYSRENIKVGVEMIDKWKVITSKAADGGSPGQDGRRKVIRKVDILPPGTVCTDTYLVIGAYNDKKQAENMVKYSKTKFFRFLVAQSSFSQNVFRDHFRFTPILDMNTEWTDEKLYKKYDLTEEEIDFIESMIRPMK